VPGVRCVIIESKEPALGACMKFVVDAHLPASLAAVLVADGHEAIHTSQLPEENKTADAVINELSVREQRGP
jgi:predicted nuclease of predicted toxin-antitoxin system